MMLNQATQLEEEQGLYFAVFGKHVAWSDHIDDIGIYSDSLSKFKSWLYYEGMSRAIESGSWLNLNDEDKLETWNHRVVLKGQKGWIFAKCVQSPDAKGRREYPLVVAVHVVAEVFPDSISQLWGELDQFLVNGVATDDQNELRNMARLCYEGCINVVSEITPLNELGFTTQSRAHFIENSLLAFSEVGFLQLMYRFAEDLKVFSKNQEAYVTRYFRISTDCRVENLALFYIELLSSQLGDLTTIGWLESVDGLFADIFVGIPDPQLIYNMKLTRSHSKPLTEVIFNLSEQEENQFRLFLKYYTNEQELKNLSLFDIGCRKPKKNFLNRISKSLKR